MSVTMKLYKYRPDVEFLGYWWYKIDNKDFDYYSQLIMNEGRKEEAYKEIGHTHSWSDCETHYPFDVGSRKRDFIGFKGKKRQLKKLEKFGIKVFKNKYTTIHYIPFDIVAYDQGWYFKKSFFKKKYSHFLCNTKKELEIFFKKYIKHTDPDGVKATKVFLDAWEDGMLCDCWW